MPVRSAADPESQPLGDSGEALLDGGRMAGVSHLDAVESLILKDPNLRFRPVIPQVGSACQPAHLVHERGDLAEFGERLLHVGGAAAAEIAAKGIADGVAGTAVHERAGDVWPAQRSTIALPASVARAPEQLRLDVLEINRDAEILELRHDLLAT